MADAILTFDLKAQPKNIIVEDNLNYGLMGWDINDVVAIITFTSPQVVVYANTDFNTPDIVPATSLFQIPTINLPLDPTTDNTNPIKGNYTLKVTWYNSVLDEEHEFLKVFQYTFDQPEISNTTVSGPYSGILTSTDTTDYGNDIYELTREHRIKYPTQLDPLQEDIVGSSAEIQVTPIYTNKWTIEITTLVEYRNSDELRILWSDSETFFECVYGSCISSMASVIDVMLMGYYEDLACQAYNQEQYQKRLVTLNTAWHLLNVAFQAGDVDEADKQSYVIQEMVEWSGSGTCDGPTSELVVPCPPYDGGGTPGDINSYVFNNGITKTVIGVAPTVQLGGSLEKDTSLLLGGFELGINAADSGKTVSQTISAANGWVIETSDGATEGRHYITSEKITLELADLSIPANTRGYEILSTGIVEKADYTAGYGDRNLVAKSYVDTNNDWGDQVVAVDSTITGNGTSGDPLVVASPFPGFDTLENDYGYNKPEYDFSEIGNTPTTLAGYGIENVYTQTELQTSGKASVHWDNITDVPTTTGYVPETGGTFTGIVAFATTNDRSVVIQKIGSGGSVGTPEGGINLISFKDGDGDEQGYVGIDASGNLVLKTSVTGQVVYIDGNTTVAGDIALSGTVDGRDIDSDGTTQDTHIADATIHVPAAGNNGEFLAWDNTFKDITDYVNLDVLDYVLSMQEDATLDPGVSPTTGDRYIILDSTSLNANFGTITGIGDNDIVEFNGTIFEVSFDASEATASVELTITLDLNANSDRQWYYSVGGSEWRDRGTSIASYWSKASGYLSPTTVGDHLLLPIGDKIAWDDGTDYITGSAANVLSFYTGSTERVQISDSYFSAIVPIKVDTINEYTADNGITIDGVVLKDNKVTAETFYVENVSTYILKDASENMTFTDAVTGAKTLAELAVGSGGTVTSVAMSGPTGLAIAGSPITSSGTLALSFSSGYSLPTTAKQTEWDTAYGWGNHASAGYLTSVNIADINATGTPNSTTFLRGDGAWFSVTGGSSYGAEDEIPITNSGSTDFDYLSTFKFNGEALVMYKGTSNRNIIISTGTFPSLISSATQNVFLGQHSLALSSGTNNMCFGNSSGINITTGFNNMCIGSNSGASLSTSAGNTFVGASSGFNSTGVSNTAIGESSGYGLTSGDNNVMLGATSGNAITTGDYNVTLGAEAGSGVSSGIANIAVGRNALGTAGSGGYNVALGYYAGWKTTGSNNVYIGRSAGQNHVGSGCVIIGLQTGQNLTSNNYSDRLMINNSNTNTPLIDGNFSSSALIINGSLKVTGNIGFYGTTPIAKPSVTGSRGGNAALADLLTDLASLGLITNSTSA